jgi:5-methylcytosine-specific restriction endonuclease McrA
VKDKYITKECKHHGETEFILEGRNAYRCKKCRSQSVSRRRQKVKAKLVEKAGGKCKICNYNKCVYALEFHHINPLEKSFGISLSGVTRSFKKMLNETQKCVLLCSNCHREVEAGVTKLDI